jgi:hypothetical protein
LENKIETAFLSLIPLFRCPNKVIFNAVLIKLFK